MTTNIYISNPANNVVGIDGKSLETGFKQGYQKLVEELQESRGITLRQGEVFSSTDILPQINASFIETSSGYIFLGKPDLLDVCLFYLVTDAAQSRLPSAMQRLPNGDLCKDEEGNVFRRPIAILNIDDTWKPILDRFSQLHRNGLMKADPMDFLVVKNITSIQDIDIEAFLAEMEEKVSRAVPLYVPQLDIPGKPNEFVTGTQANSERPKIFTCCSFSTKSELFLKTAEEVGKQLALAGFDIMGGGGRGGMMEKIQKSAQDNGAHVTGITFPDLNAMVPDYEGQGNKTFGINLILNTGKMAPRIKHMTRGSSGVLIAPGGLGTDTEALGPILMGKQPIVILNMLNPDTGERCHEKLIELLEYLGKKKGEDFHVVEPPNLSTIEKTAQNAANEVVQKFRELLKEKQIPAVRI